MEEGDPARLPAIPAKRYFTIGEVSELCGVKPYVLRYWEQEFTQLRPMKRRGNRRYYQHHEVLLIRRIRDLLYDQGFTISGARNRLTEHGAPLPDKAASADGGAEVVADGVADRAAEGGETTGPLEMGGGFVAPVEGAAASPQAASCGREPAEPLGLGLAARFVDLSVTQLRAELQSIRALLGG